LTLLRCPHASNSVHISVVDYENEWWLHTAGCHPLRGPFAVVADVAVVFGVGGVEEEEAEGEGRDEGLHACDDELVAQLALV
jgi:hypothetical protein